MSGISENDFITILHAAIKERGLSGHHIDSLNYFTRDGIRQIITKWFSHDIRHANTRDTTPEDQSIESIHFKLTYPNVYLEPVVVPNGDSTTIMTPKMARDRDLTYGANLFLDVNCVFTATLKAGGTVVRTIDLKKVLVSIIPIGVKTDMCILNGMSREALLEAGEDPNDPGGYMIVKGTEWVINCLENSCFNSMSIYRTDKVDNELVRGTIICKSGDAFEHTYQSKFMLLKDNRIVFEITTGKKEVLLLPFFSVFRLFGVSSDRDITEYILGSSANSRDDLNVVLLDLIEKAFDANYLETEHYKVCYTAGDTALAIARMRYPELESDDAINNEDLCRHFNNKIMEIFDTRVIQQYGSSINDRRVKAIMIGKYYRDVLLVYLNLAPITDRDSLKIKRIHPAGITLSKSFKQQFNQIVHSKLKLKILKKLTDEPFHTSDLEMEIKNTLINEGPKLRDALGGSISRGDETIKVGNIEITNRVSSQMLQHKNDLNVISALNVITSFNQSSAKATDRADQMRRVHNTNQGFICPNYSADTGEAVGVNKSFAISSEITMSTSSIALENFIRTNKDTPLIPLMSVEPTKMGSLCAVSVNGKCIGFCENQIDYATKYRQYRREGKLHKHTSIVTEPTVAEVNFWTDFGRLVRPIIIVYNNLADIIDAVKNNKTPPKFKQWINLTKKHIYDIWEGLIDLSDLVTAGIIEYISAGEQLNCLASPNYDEFLENENNILMQYTHCDIPQALLGLVSLASPLANYSSAVRITMSTNHVKQACNRFNCAWADRHDNGSYFTFRTEHPLVGTITNAHVYPNGVNLIIATAMHNGNNMEDSGDVNAGAIDLGMFNGIYLKEEIVKPDEDTRIGPIDHSKTIGIKGHAKYDQLDSNGLIKVGSRVTSNTVLVSMYSRLAEPEQGTYYFTDKSHIYHGKEEFVIKDVILDKDGDLNIICKIFMYSVRNMNNGSKVASKMGNKGIVAVLTSTEDMPYTLGGIGPAIIINTHSFPSRMAISQDLEGTLALYAAQFGSFIDATTFKKIDIDAVLKRLKEVPGHGDEGLDAGHQYLYNGRTGERMPVKIFMVPNCYQRLGKFVENAYYAIHTGPTSTSTQQPLSGKRHNGGLRLGEMENATLTAHGAMRFVDEKIREDSDGRDIYICARCGKRAIVNKKEGLYKCIKCKGKAVICEVASTYMANKFMHMAEGMNLDMTFKLSRSCNIGH